MAAGLVLIVINVHTTGLWANLVLLTGAGSLQYGSLLLIITGKDSGMSILRQSWAKVSPVTLPSFSILPF